MILGQNRWNKPMWPERINKDTGEVYRFERFEDFVTTQPLAGLGADMAKIKAVCGDDLVALDMIDRAVQRTPADNKPLDNIQERSPTGTSRDRALRRLRTHAPELHARVLAREMTIADAAREAGFRKPPDAFRTAQNAWAKMIPEEREPGRREFSPSGVRPPLSAWNCIKSFQPW
jgi:hypothetical protein